MPELYENIRSFVRDSLERRNHADVHEFLRPSVYWQDFSRYTAYVRTLPASELKFIRNHTWHLNSDQYGFYYFCLDGSRRALLEEYHYLKRKLNVQVSFGEDQSGLGFETDEGRISKDVVRYLLVLNDLVKHRAISISGEQTILEIGGGYGGLARMCLALNPATAYVIVDIEETLFFQAVYLTNTFGSDRVVLCGPRETLITKPKPGHIYLVPQSDFKKVLGCQFDLAINQQSMQEMNEMQIENYCDLMQKNTRQFYSCNISQHSKVVTDKTGIIEGLNAYLIRKFQSIVWDSENEAGLITRILRRFPRLEIAWSEIVTMASHVEFIQKAYHSVFKRPLRRFSDVNLRRLIFRCKN